ncbi:ataxin-8 [Aplysia californica]|uniref:Ataxin-8 n=1 Tax=Aplysia californica TaxID=6500 RepID=A0ABM1AAS5_APLCA|nr:ataxin-8 [Aplysia californica]
MADQQQAQQTMQPPVPQAAAPQPHVAQQPQPQQHPPPAPTPSQQQQQQQQQQQLQQSQQQQLQQQLAAAQQQQQQPRVSSVGSIQGVVAPPAPTPQPSLAAANALRSPSTPMPPLQVIGQPMHGQSYLPQFQSYAQPFMLPNPNALGSFL